MKLQKPNRQRAGFTLIELLVVMIILAILAAFAIPRVLGRTDDARRAAAVADISTYKTALKMYRADNGTYPSTEQGLDALWRAPTSDPVPLNWREPYIDEPPKLDPWGNPFQYVYPGEFSPDFDLYSFGADGQPGGDGNNADIGLPEDATSY